MDQTTNTGATDKPVKQKTAVGKILAGIGKDVVIVGSFIGKEAGIIATLFSKEEPKLQEDLKAVSGVVQIIKTEITETPDIVIYLIKKQFPQFDPATLQALLTKVSTDLKIVSDIAAPTLQETIANLQAHASQLTGNATKSFWTSFFNLLAAEVSPGTLWSKIVVFGVYIYNNFIKKSA